MHLHIGHLYPHTMSTYGDTGNITAMVQRAQWRGLEVTVHELDLGASVPENIDFYFFGGGQDAAQGSLQEDLLDKKGARLRQDIAAGVPLLAICGGYQLLGSYYQPHDGKKIEGLGIFPVKTQASTQRMIGDLVIKSNPGLGFTDSTLTIVGFENHSGKTTFLTPEASPLGSVIHGFGNNGEDRTEGCIAGSAIGCYLHGSLLPKNPHLADYLLQQACRRHDPAYSLPPLDDSLEWRAHASIVGRYAN